jgi:hypothetical protein
MLGLPSQRERRDVWVRPSASPWPLLAIATTGGPPVRALRWQYLLAPIGPALRHGVPTTVIGFAATFLLPARAGGHRPYLLARREGLNATAAFATIIPERLLTSSPSRAVSVRRRS